MSSSPSTVPSRASRPAEGVEVPIPGSDNLTWIDLTVPPPPPASTPPPPPQSRASVRPRRAGSCHVFSGDPPAYVIWRVHDDQPNVLEIIELFPSKEFPEKGLRLFFPDDIFPFSFICKHEVVSLSTSIYMIYALTVSGVAYLFKLRSLYAHTSGSIFPGSDIDAFNVQNHSRITAVEAIFGCLMIGREDGSVSCYNLGTVDEGSLGFTLEFRDDVGIGRLWNLMSRGRIIAAVLDLAVHEMFGRKFLFVVHIDGSLRIWDLFSNTKIFNHSIIMQETEGSLSRFWVSNANYDTCQFLLAVQFEGYSDSNFGMIAVYCLNFNEEKLTLVLDSSVKYIPLDEGRLVDLKLTYDKLWLLKEEGPILYNLSYSDFNMDGECTYNLHEEFIADKLFQGSEHLSDDLLWTSLSAFSSTKDQIPYVISVIFLRRLLQPGIFLNSALYASILDQKGYMTDHEVQSLTISGLKQELLSIIESKGAATNLSSFVYYWKKFSSHFFHHWCQNNCPYSLFIDPSSGAIGLIRKSSISLFRKLENIEMVMDGSYDELDDIRQSGLILPGDDLDCEILFDILRSMRTVRRQLGRASSSVFYECLANPSIVSYEDTVFHLLKFLEAGHGSSMSASVSLPVGDDATWEMKQADHRNHRKFSIDMYLSLMGLHSKAASWSRVLDVIEIYLKNFLPDKLSMHTGSKSFFSVNSSLLVQATCQVSGVTFDCAFNMYMLLGYLANVNVQVQMAQADLSRIRLKIMPTIENIIMYWYILHFISTTQTEAYILEDFSSKLSSLHIDKHADNRPLDGVLGASGLTLACLLSFPVFPNEDGFVTSMSFLDPSKFVDPVWNFCRWAIWGKTDHGPNVLWRSLEIACIFLQNRQYEAAENLLAVIDAHISKNKFLLNMVGDYGACLHLLGYCLVVRGHDALNMVLKEWKIREAVRCFFRAATSGEETFVSLQNLSFQTGFHCPGNSGSVIVWKFFYYQWAMQFFEQYNLSEAACQFALSALEQVDEVHGNESSGPDTLLEPVDAVKGKLWANVFKFSVDLGYYGDAYCAVISNPDEDSKLICLRRFIIVLYEQGESKILCNGEFPFVGLVEKVEQELLWKAERSDIFSRPNLYRLLYAFQMYRNNWRKAATYMYHYSNRLKQEMIAENLQDSLLEVLRALSASINALQLVHSPHAWIDCQHKNYLHPDKSSPNKRPRQGFIENSSITFDTESESSHCHIDIETLEKEYALLSAQYLLSAMNIKYNITGNRAHIFTTVDALIEANLYDMAFTLLLKFCKGSKLKRELERVFVAISQKCCASNGNSFIVGSHMARDLILTSDGGKFDFNGKAEASPVMLQPSGYSLWELLETYLEKYKMLHPRLAVNVAETLLCTDPQIDLPLWLVHMFKGGRRAKSWGMAGNELDPATLFRLYVDYGRYGEATNLLLEYLEAFASMRPADIINRKRMSAVCFPYVAIERLWCHLEEVQSSGHMVDQCVRLKNLMCGAMQNHLKQVKVDSDDALASAAV